MNRDELRESLIAIFVRRGHKGKEVVEEVKEILFLLAPILADAEKWRRVKEMEQKDPWRIIAVGDLITALEGEVKE